MGDRAGEKSAIYMHNKDPQRADSARGTMKRIDNKNRQTIVDDCIGQVFGKLIVYEFVGYRKTPRGSSVPYVGCVCECGSTKNISLWDLRSGKSKTCGFNHPHYDDRSVPAFNRIYNHSYKSRALKTGTEFLITREQFMELSQAPCHYCGALPNSTTYRGNGKRGVCKTGKGISQFVYNGMDRVDSRGGYTVDNVVTCCCICNHAKHTMSYDEFISWLDRIVEFRK